MEIRFNLLMVFTLFIVLAACGTVQLSRDQLNQQYPKMAQLEKGLDSAKEREIDLFAPATYKKALNEYINAYMAAQKGLQNEVESNTDNGLNSLNKALEIADQTQNLLSEVLVARNRAKQAEADKLYPEDMKKLDADLINIGELVENNSIEKAKKRRPELLKGYSDLELVALKQDTIETAQTAIKRAEENDAMKLAPKTLTKAKEAMTLAQSVLEVDRTNRAKANAHAHNATLLANRGYQIAETIKDMKRRDLSPEDVILSYQNDIASLALLLGKDLPFDKPNEETMKSLRHDVGQLVDSDSSNKQRAEELENKLSQLLDEHAAEIAQLKKQHYEELAQLEARLSGEITVLGKTQEHMVRLQKEHRERLERVQALFDDAEANVFQQKSNVLISVHGFQFPPGSSEIRPENFTLMNKIAQAIDEFKSAKIAVSGHTDSTGSASVNKTLSDKRALSVAKFLVEVAGITPTRISSSGYGQEKPVASNLTPEGRAKNRRVEILIINE